MDYKKFKAYWDKAAELSQEKGNEKEMRECVENLKVLYPKCLNDKRFEHKPHFLCYLSSFANYCGMYTDSIVYGFESLRIFLNPPFCDSNIAYVAMIFEQIATAHQNLGLYEASFSDYSSAYRMWNHCPHTPRSTVEHFENVYLAKSCEILEKLYP